MNKKKVVVIGGGTGTYTVLRGLRKYPELELTAVVTMADDGGSNKVLRDEFGMLPTSGVRQCMVALSSNAGLLRKLFSYRYYQGVGISGMTFGNLFMAAATDILGDERAAIKETAKLLGVKGRILPTTYEALSLIATFEDRTEVLGQHAIDGSGKDMGDLRIAKLRAIPQTTIDDEARVAIEEADLIVLGPGDLYGNTIVNLIVKGMPEAILKSKAKMVFVVNLMTKRGESPKYKASDYLADIAKYLPIERIDVVVVNSDLEIDAKVSAKYAKEGAGMVVDDLEEFKVHQVASSSRSKFQVIREKLLAHGEVKKETGDKIERSMARHDGARLAKVILSLV